MQEEDEAVGESDPGHEDKLDQGAGEVVGHGHAIDQDRDAPGVQSRRDGGGQENPDQLREAGKAPDAVIQSEENKDDQTDHGIRGNEHTPGVPVHHRDIGKLTVIADPEGQEIRQAHGGIVEEAEEHGDDLPMFNQGAFLGTRIIHKGATSLKQR